MTDTGEALLATALAVAAFSLTAIATVWLLYRLAARKAESIIVVSVSILTLVAIFAAVSSSGELSTALIALAGTGLGSLAAALTSLFGKGEVPKMTEQPDAVDAPVDEAADDIDPDTIDVDEAHDGEEFEPPDTDVHDSEHNEPSVSDGQGGVRDGVQPQ